MKKHFIISIFFTVGLFSLLLFSCKKDAEEEQSKTNKLLFSVEDIKGVWLNLEGGCGGNWAWSPPDPRKVIFDNYNVSIYGAGSPYHDPIIMDSIPFAKGSFSIINIESQLSLEKITMTLAYDTSHYHYVFTDDTNKVNANKVDFEFRIYNNTKAGKTFLDMYFKSCSTMNNPERKKISCNPLMCTTVLSKQ